MAPRLRLRLLSFPTGLELRRQRGMWATMDTLTPSERSERMALVRAKDTSPEILVRRLARHLGYSFGLHGRDLPGKPDLVFRSRRKAIFVHGCFWHRHGNKNCALARLPKSRREFWVPKLESNRIRDARNQKALRALGWSFLVIWECQLRDIHRVEKRIAAFLSREQREAA